MPKHTPGPWEINYNGTINHIKSIAEHPQGMTPTIARFDPNLCGYSITAEEGLANARLMAAAPDLLECVEAMIAEYEEGREPCFDIREKCRDAIAKAKGCHELFGCNDSEHDEVCPAS